MGVVLDELYGLSVASGGVGVLEGRKFAPGDPLCRPHYPLEPLLAALRPVPCPEP